MKFYRIECEDLEKYREDHYLVSYDAGCYLCLARRARSLYDEIMGAWHPYTRDLDYSPSHWTSWLETVIKYHPVVVPAGEAFMILYSLNQREP